MSFDGKGVKMRFASVLPWVELKSFRGQSAVPPTFWMPWRADQASACMHAFKSKGTGSTNNTLS